MEIMIIVGARPNFMKAAPLIAAIREHNRRTGALCTAQRSADIGMIRHVLVHTGQHYDEAMSDSFFADLELPKPDVHLGVGSGSHASQTAEIMKRFEEVLLAARPDVLVVVGDVNSTLACTLVAAKISLDSNGVRPLIAHVEAGLRSFDRTMPEEINRILTDHAADLLFVTEESAIQNLRREGIPPEKVHFVGNTMIDSLLTFRDKAEASAILDTLGLRTRAGHSKGRSGVQRYALLTLHRPANVDHRSSFLNILEGIKEFSDSCPIIFPAHPRTRKRIVEFGLSRRFTVKDRLPSSTDSSPIPTKSGIHLVDPLGYLDFLCLMTHAELVLTDSGGIQEETTFLGIPCVTLRTNTERPSTVQRGTNVLAGVGQLSIREAIRLQTNGARRKSIPAQWDGKAGRRIVEQLLKMLPGTTSAKQTAEVPCGP